MQEHFEQFTYTKSKDRTETYNKLIGLCLAIEALTGGCAYDHYEPSELLHGICWF
jgi:hypothetical protein